MDLRNKAVLIVGLGQSGLAAAHYAVGARRLVLNDVRASMPQELVSKFPASVEWALGGHELANPSDFDLVIVSPGVTPYPALLQAERKGVEVIGELEFGVRAALEHSPQAKVFAIGGTNGKSTVTTLVAKMLQQQSQAVFAGGNLGTPLIGHTRATWEHIVLEVSSFQMERAPTFHPHASALLNITPDHLDRYASFEEYAAAKGNAFQNQVAGDIAVAPFDDAVCQRQVTRGGATLVTFGEGAGATLKVSADSIVDTRTGESFQRQEFLLQGGHNALNVAAAIGLVRPYLRSREPIDHVLRTFQGLDHRTVYVETIDGVRYYDDSKGTNVGASVTALLGMREPKTVLIAGGKDKGGSYEPLRDALIEKGRAVVLIGEASDLIEKGLGGKVPTVRATSMRDAVQKARGLAKEGDAVLLSPACSSFDMFRDYKHRGEEFVQAVHLEAKN